MASFEVQVGEQERLQDQGESLSASPASGAAAGCGGGARGGAGGTADPSASAGLVMLSADDHHLEAADYDASVQLLYCGHLSVPGLNEEDLPKTMVNTFISSTFDDTKFE